MLYSFSRLSDPVVHELRCGRKVLLIRAEQIAPAFPPALILRKLSFLRRCSPQQERLLCMGLISAFLFFVWPASRSIREDDGLMSFDVVSTGFRFEGSPLKERQPDDFVRIR